MYPISKKKQKYPAIYPQQPTCIGRLKLHSLQVNLVILATGKLAHRLNCKAEPQPRESRANSGSHSLGQGPCLLNYSHFFKNFLRLRKQIGTEPIKPHLT